MGNVGGRCGWEGVVGEAHHTATPGGMQGNGCGVENLCVRAACGVWGGVGW